MLGSKEIIASLFPQMSQLITSPGIVPVALGISFYTNRNKFGTGELLQEQSQMILC